MEPQEEFTNKVMKRPNVHTMVLMKVEPLKVEPKGWGTMHLGLPL
jgi:hypothetical protein